MSAMPDLLLKPAPEVKSNAKPPAKAPEPSKNEPSGFAQVYAKERQTQSSERPGEAKKATESRGGEKNDEAEAAASTDAEKPEIAADGKTLPADEPAQEELDPLLAMAMSGMQPQPAQAAVSEEGQDAALTAVAEITTQVKGEASVEGETSEAMLGTVQLPAETQAKAQFKPEAANDAKASADTKSADFAEAMMNMGKKTESTDGSKESSVDIGLEKVSGEALESLKESTQPNRPDQFVSKLNALTQAINQQSGAVQRAPLVPGQPVAMQQNGWTEAVVDKVMWMSSQNLKSAEIQLDPAELGRLEVRVHLSQDSAQVTFASPHAGVRDALEGQMHRLRDMFTQQGMSLADANVSDQSLNRGWQGQEQGEAGRGGSGRGNGLAGGVEEGGLAVNQDVRSERLSMGRGLVDYYA